MIQTKIDHSETVNKNYKKLIIVIKKGNDLMSRKCDYLECSAERVHRERWELYQIKTMAEYLREGMSIATVWKMKAVLVYTVTMRAVSGPDHGGISVRKFM